MTTPAIYGPVALDELLPHVDDVEVLELAVRETQPALHGELVSAADYLALAFADTFVASRQTQRTYRRACRHFAAWLGPLAGPDELSAANVARYHAQLVNRGLSSATIKKERAALNSWLRWLAEHEHVPTAQVRAALSVRLPRARAAEQREIPKHLTEAQYNQLIREAKARIADDPLAGARDLAIVLVLGDAGLRCAELAQLERRDFLPARQGADLRRLNVRHGKGDRQRLVTLSTRAARAIVRWDRERTHAFGAPADDKPLFVTLGRRRRNGTYTQPGAAVGQPVLAKVIRRLGAGAELPPELAHPHALRHTCATELLRVPGATLADVRLLLGHASVKTTSIYLATDEHRQEQVIASRERGRSTLDDDRDS